MVNLVYYFIGSYINASGIDENTQAGESSQLMRRVEQLLSRLFFTDHAATVVHLTAFFSLDLSNRKINPRCNRPSLRTSMLSLLLVDCSITRGYAVN